MITLKKVMRTNATSCLIFGITFLLAPTEIALFLSKEIPAPDIALIVLGASLTINGCALIWESLKSSPKRSSIIYFAVGDLIWVIATIILLFLGMWITSFNGIIASSLIAVIVAIFGILQITHINQ